MVFNLLVLGAGRGVVVRILLMIADRYRWVGKYWQIKLTKFEIFSSSSHLRPQATSCRGG